jgi:hypothetical protein
MLIIMNVLNNQLIFNIKTLLMEPVHARQAMHDSTIPQVGDTIGHAPVKDGMQYIPRLRG